MARHYPAPRYPWVVEPFAGAAGYSTWHGAQRAALVDVDPVLARLWAWLIATTAREVRGLPLIGAGQDVRTLRLPPGAQDLIAFWLNKGCTRPRRTASAWMRSGVRPGSFWGDAVRDRIASQVHRIRDWRVFLGTYRDLPDVEATWFIDPPYAGRPGSHYSFGSAKIDYADLADWCRTRRGQVIVCEAAGATWLPFKPFGTFKANHTRGVTHESVWVNG